MKPAKAIASKSSDLCDSKSSDSEDNDAVTKRLRDSNDHDDDKLTFKCRKVDPNNSYNNDVVELLSDDETDDVVFVKEDNMKKEDKTDLQDKNKSEHNGMSIANNEYFDVNDSALMHDLLSHFSSKDGNDDDDSDSDCGTSIFSTQATSENSSLKKDTVNGKSSAKCDESLKLAEKIVENGLEFDDWDDETGGLDLHKFTRCKIVSIVRKARVTQITVEAEESFHHALVMCYDSWQYTKIVEGELVVIKADKSNGNWVINNTVGMLVSNPDELVAGTSVVQGIFCERKGVLLQKYNGINCLPNIPADDAVMTCGIIVHELVQTALKDEIYNLDGLKRLLDKILVYPHIVLALYASELTTKKIREMVQEYVVKVEAFLGRYIIGKSPSESDNNFNGQISCIRDIEENVWLPSLGIKGKIDVTVEVSVDYRRKILPLEIKTGRASFSHEHKGQLFLYCMMLENLGYRINSGLLLYIKENMMREIRSTRHEQRDLILLRNSLAYYLSLKPNIVEKTTKNGKEKVKVWGLTELPEPINHLVGCQRCPFNTVCCLYAKEEKLEFPEGHFYNLIYPSALAHLTDDHIEYVTNWVSMLQIEDAHNRSVDANRHIWSQKPEVRESQRTCLSYLNVDNVTKDQYKNEYFHRFIRGSTDPSIKLNLKTFKEVFSEQDYVMINTCVRVNIVTGIVVNITKDSVTLSLNKDITRWETQAYYHIDAVPQITMPYKVLGTIATLLADNDIIRRIRSIIIDRIPARFDSEIPAGLKTEGAKKIFERLNNYQQVALTASVQTKDFVMLKGMPGTGKTHTLVALIEILNYLGYSVLITAHTHIAVDNILLKLHNRNMDFLRLGSKTRVHPLLHKYTDDTFLLQCNTPEKLEAEFNKKKIVGVTCLGANHALLTKRMFDYCVVDECTQILQPIIIRPLFNAEKYVIVGDPDQLSAVVRSSEARKSGMDEDIFSRLDSENNTRVLKQQYRMNKPIMDLSNALTYKGQLIMGNDKISNATLEFTNTKIMNSCEGWIRKALSCDLKHAVVFLNTQDISTSGFKNNSPDELANCINHLEAAMAIRICNVLTQTGIKIEDIGIIAPYNAQVHLLKRTVEEKVEINTVDQYQGRDKSVIILSCTRNDLRNITRQTNEYEILEDHTRLNVALTRAKHKLIIIGNKMSLMRYTPFNKLFKIIKDKELLLKCAYDDFSVDDLRQVIEK